MIQVLADGRVQMTLDPAFARLVLKGALTDANAMTMAAGASPEWKAKWSARTESIRKLWVMLPVEGLEWPGTAPLVMTGPHTMDITDDVAACLATIDDDLEDLF